MELNNPVDSTISLKSVHTLQYDSLKNNLKDKEILLECHEAIKTVLENAPFTNENETCLENLSKIGKNLESEIKEKKEQLKSIDEIKDHFIEKLLVPDDDRNDNFNIEHLLLSVPL